MHLHPGKVLTLYIIAIFLTMLTLSNIKVTAIANFLPLFDVMIIYYFAIYRPNIFSAWFLFLLGLMSDAMNGLPLGLTSIIYIIAVKIFIHLGQKIMVRENFKQVFQQFTAFIFTILALKWLFLSLYYLKLYNIYPPLIQFSISISIYVIMHKFFDYLSKTLLGRDIDA
jgi:rod shape-determining protein MreD